MVRWFRWVGIAALVFLFAVVLQKALKPQPALPELAVLESSAVTIDGTVFSLVRGEAYKRDGSNWSHFASVYDPDFFQKNYVVENGVVHRLDDEGKRHVVSKSFRSGFEGGASVRELIGVEPGWTSFVLQSPATPTIKDYVRLRAEILKGKASFVDNRVEPSREFSQSGQQALKCVSRAPSWGMVCAKASIETELIHFVEGDDFWFSGWFLIQDGKPLTLMDLETVWATEHPGIRIQFDDEGALFVELKWAGKPTFRQPRDARTLFPHRQWVHVVTHFKLHAGNKGVVRVWQDGRKIIDATGQTLPFAQAVYNSLEVGITATQHDATVFVDAVEVSGEPLRTGARE